MEDEAEVKEFSEEGSVEVDKGCGSYHLWSTVRGVAYAGLYKSVERGVRGDIS